MKNFKPWEDHSHTVVSIAQSLVSVCQQTMTRAQLRQWETGESNPNDFMDANMVLDGIIENHGINLWGDDGAMGDAEIDFMNECFSAADALIKTLSKSAYGFVDLYESINDIHAQWDEGKIKVREAEELVKKCCLKFLKEFTE